MKTSDIWKWFQDHPEADVCFSTEDGKIHLTHALAWNHLTALPDPLWDEQITEWHREDTP